MGIGKCNQPKADRFKEELRLVTERAAAGVVWEVAGVALILFPLQESVGTPGAAACPSRQNGHACEIVCGHSA